MAHPAKSQAQREHGWRLRLARERKGLSQEALGEMMGVGATTVQGWEKGRNQIDIVALGWVVGLVTFLLGTWLSADEVFRRIEIGLVLSSLAALAAFALGLRHRLRVGAVPTQSSMMEAISDMPFET
jgi:transcriptional regulator with XRE-family HTH domain